MAKQNADNQQSSSVGFFDKFNVPIQISVALFTIVAYAVAVAYYMGSLSTELKEYKDSSKERMVNMENRFEDYQKEFKDLAEAVHVNNRRLPDNFEECFYNVCREAREK